MRKGNVFVEKRDGICYTYRGYEYQPIQAYT